MEVSQEIRRVVFKLILALFAAQLIIVPWSFSVPVSATTRVNWVVEYAPIFSKPSSRATIEVGRLLVQLMVTGGAVVGWLSLTKNGGGRNE